MGTIIFAVGEYFIVGYTADFNKLVRYGNFSYNFKLSA